MRKFIISLVLLTIAITQPVQAQPAPGLIPAQMAAAGAWIGLVSEALDVSHSGYIAAKPDLQAASAALKSTAGPKAAAARLRGAIKLQRAALARSDAMLDGLPPPPVALDAVLSRAGLTGARIIADAKQQNGALDRLFVMMGQLVVALEAGDARRVATLAPRMIEGSFVMLDNQALLLRNRQALFPPEESTHQALAVQQGLYIGMAQVMRAAAAVHANPGAKVNVAPVRTGLAQLSTDIARAAMNGRDNLMREEAALRQETARIEALGTAEQKAALARVATIFALERRTFALGDRLAAVIKGHAGAMTQPQIAATPIRAFVAPYEAIEFELDAIFKQQAGALAGG